MFNVSSKLLEDCFLVGSMLIMMVLIAVFFSYLSFKKGEAEKMLLDVNSILERRDRKRLHTIMAGTSLTVMSEESLKEHIKFLDSRGHDVSLIRKEADDERAKRFCRREIGLL